VFIAPTCGVRRRLRKRNFSANGEKMIGKLGLSERFRCNNLKRGADAGKFFSRQGARQR